MNFTKYILKLKFQFSPVRSVHMILLLHFHYIFLAGYNVRISAVRHRLRLTKSLHCYFLIGVIAFSLRQFLL